MEPLLAIKDTISRSCQYYDLTTLKVSSTVTFTITPIFVTMQVGLVTSKLGSLTKLYLHRDTAMYLIRTLQNCLAD